MTDIPVDSVFSSTPALQEIRSQGYAKQFGIARLFKGRALPSARSRNGPSSPERLQGETGRLGLTFRHCRPVIPIHRIRTLRSALRTVRLLYVLHFSCRRKLLGCQSFEVYVSNSRRR